MEGKQFLYFITDKEGLFSTFQNGFLEWVGYPVPLQFSPDGWQDFAILIERNKDFFGLDRTYGTPQNFVEDAAGILKSIFYNSGIEGIANLTIAEQKLYFSDIEYGYYYDLLTRCEIDFSTYLHASEKVTAQILDGELTRLLKANKSTQYEIPLNGNSVNLVMDGLKLKQFSNYIISEPTDFNYVPNGNNLPGWLQTSTEAKTQLGTKSVIRQREDRNPQIFSSGMYILKTSVATDVTFAFDFGMTCSLAPGISPNPLVKYFFGVKVFDKLGNLVLPIFTLYEIDGPDNLYRHNQIKGTKTVTIPANSSVFIFSGINFSNEGGAESGLAVYFTYDTKTSTGLDSDANLTLNYNYVYPTTTVQAIPPDKLWQRLVSMATGGRYSGASNLFSGLASQVNPYILKSYPFTLYTSGDGLRGLPGSVLKTSIADFFQSINSTFCVGLGIINNQLRIEPKAFWVTAAPADVIMLGEGSALRVSPAIDHIFNTISVGCQNQTYNEALGDINGRYEFNMTHYYSTPITKVTADLNLVSKYRRDMYGAEYERINLDGKTTTDSTADNAIFELHAKAVTIPITWRGRNGLPIIINDPIYYILNRDSNQYTTGLLDQASAFNIQLSPKHCLYRHGDYIRSCLDKLDSKNIVFNSADKNTPMVTAYPNFKIDERAVAKISDMDPQIFKPYIIEDTTPVADSFTTGGIVKKYLFTYQNGRITVGGFAVKTSIQPANDKQQSFQLLCAPDTDLTQLINVWE